MIKTIKPDNVRLAIPADDQAIFDLLRNKLYYENGAFSVDDEKTMRTIQTATRGEGGIIGIIDGNNGDLAGTIGMQLGQFWYSSDWHVEEFWNFVSPDYRKSDYAKNLIDFAKWCAEKMELVLNIGILSTDRTEAKQRLYARRLQPAGMFFFHNLAVSKGPANIRNK